MKKILFTLILLIIFTIIGSLSWLHLTFNTERSKFICNTNLQESNIEDNIKTRMKVHLSNDPYISSYLTQEELTYLLNNLDAIKDTHTGICTKLQEDDQLIQLFIYKSSVIWVEVDIKLYKDVDKSSNKDTPLGIQSIHIAQIKLPDSITNTLNTTLQQSYKDYFNNKFIDARKLSGLEILNGKIYLYSKD